MSRACELVQRVLEADNLDVNPEDYLSRTLPQLSQQNYALKSPVAPAAEGTSPLRVVLHHSLSSGPRGTPREEWVTHIENMELGGYCWGHYIRDYDEAVADYKARCKKYGVDWNQSETFVDE